jgi:hypothetical protein
MQRQERKFSSPVLLDEGGHVLDHIPEPEIKKVIKRDYNIEPIFEEENLIEKDYGKDSKITGDSEIHCRVEMREAEDFLENEPVVECRIEKPSAAETPKKRGFFERLLKGKEKTEEDEEEIEKPGFIEDTEKEESKEREIKDFDLEKADLSGVTIADLRDMHRRKIVVTKKEKLEEKKRIETKNKLIEARKEELRLMKEKESKDLDKILGGKEVLEEDSDFENRKEFDDELV